MIAIGSAGEYQYCTLACLRAGLVAETGMIRRYRVEVTTDDKGWVSVKVPAIPEVHAEAHTREQALRFAANAVTSHLKSSAATGRDIPSSDIDAIVVDI